MRRKMVTCLLTIALLSIVPFVEAQQPKKVARIGFLLANTRSSESNRVEALRQGLREVGYVEGKNIVIEHRYAAGKLDWLPDLAAELVRLKVDAIVTTGTPSTHAAQQATKTIPIVMTLVGTPVPRFVASLARPGGNITGLTQVRRDLNGKRIELLKEAFPKISLVAMFANTALPDQEMREDFRQAQVAADALGVKLLSLEVRAPKPDFDGAFRTATSARVGALIVAPGPAVNLYRKRLAELAAKNRLPAMYPSSEFVDDGGLLSYGPDYDDLIRRGAIYVDKILKGRKPAELPVEQPTKFELVINLKTAKQIGLTIPPNVLARADKVIR